MDRRGLLLATGAMLAAGCARVSPAPVIVPASTPTAARPPLAVGDDGTPAGALLAQLIAQVLVARGRDAAITPAAADWQAALGDGSLAAFPAFAATLWTQLSDHGEYPAATDDLLTDVASFLAPEVSTLATEGVDGGLVWLVTGETAEAGITSLERIAAWSKGKTAAIPGVATSRADGIPGLVGVYHGAFRPATVEDPVQRAGQLVSGEASVAAFRRTEYTGAADLVALDDPDRFGLNDPLLVLLHGDLADADPDAVLAITGVTEVLTTAALIDLQAKAAAGAGTREVAAQWLTTNGLA